MTTCAPPPERQTDAMVVQAEGGAVLASLEVVPAHLLDGGEVVHFAIKPSRWFVLLISLRWVLAGIALMVVSYSAWVPQQSHWYLYQSGWCIAALRLGWAMLEWVSRLYVLTNRRVMRLRGVFNVELFECSLGRIQNTYLTASLSERLTGTGTITVETASTAGSSAWLMVSRPLEVHEKLREAILRAQNRGGNGL
jgi:uncharacterized membrane protein YdbT with pleckstrin-like domain